MQPKPSDPLDLANPSLDLIRQRVDLWNHRFHALSADLARIESNIADLLGLQPDPDEGHNNSKRK